MFEVNSNAHAKRFVGTGIAVGIMLICLSSSSLAQQPVLDLPEYVPPVSFSEILKGLRDESIKSSFDRNRELCKAVDDRGVGFALSTNARSVLSNAGASEPLFTAISRGQKKRTDEIFRLLNQFREDFYGKDIVTRKKTISEGRELLDRLGDPDLLIGEERELREMVQYLKDSLPKMEASLQRLLNPKPDH